MINVKMIDEMLHACEPAVLEQAKRNLQKNKNISVKCYLDESEVNFEAFIGEGTTKIWMPQMVMNGHGVIQELSCQCQSKTQICVHKVILLLAIRTMLQTGCGDYRMALKSETAAALSRALTQN